MHTAVKANKHSIPIGWRAALQLHIELVGHGECLLLQRGHLGAHHGELVLEVVDAVHRGVLLGAHGAVGPVLGLACVVDKVVFRLGE